MERFEQLTDMICAELERIQNKGELSSASLNQAHMLASTWKDLESAAEKAKAREAGYSEAYPRYYRRGVYDDGSSYGPGRGRNARRDSMGRYSEESRRYDDDRSYDDGGESYRNR